MCKRKCKCVYPLVSWNTQRLFVIVNLDSLVWGTKFGSSFSPGAKPSLLVDSSWTGHSVAVTGGHMNVHGHFEQTVSTVHIFVDIKLVHGPFPPFSSLSKDTQNVLDGFCVSDIEAQPFQLFHTRDRFPKPWCASQICHHLDSAHTSLCFLWLCGSCVVFSWLVLLIAHHAC